MFIFLLIAATDSITSDVPFSTCCFFEKRLKIKDCFQIKIGIFLLNIAATKMLGVLKNK